MSYRFIIRYCKIIDSVFLIDTLGRMPETRIHSKLSVHGLDCNDRETAEERQTYYENLCGYQRPLFPEVTSFEIKTHPWLGHYGTHYDVYDNTGRHVIGSFSEDLAVEFKEWLEKELQHG